LKTVKKPGKKEDNNALPGKFPLEDMLWLGKEVINGGDGI